MTKQEQANDIFFRFRTSVDISNEEAKICAIIAADMMIEQNGEIYLANLGEKANEYYAKKNSYLFELKQEIENL